MQLAFYAWLERHEKPRIELLESADELDAILADVYASCAPSATRYLLLIHDLARCTDALLENIARSFVDDSTATTAAANTTAAVRVLEMRRPLSAEAATLVARRLPALSGACRMLIVLHRYEAAASFFVAFQLVGVLRDLQTRLCGARQKCAAIRGMWFAAKTFFRAAREHRRFAAARGAQSACGRFV